MRVRYHFYRSTAKKCVNRDRLYFEDLCEIPTSIYSKNHASIFLMSLYLLDRTTEKYVEHVVRSIFVDKHKNQPKKMLSLNR